MDVSDRVRDLLEPLVSAQGLELFDVQHVGGTLRVSVDRPGGVDLDDLSVATRIVSDALDRADPIPGRYLLEVSSPGVERPLRKPAHFRGAVGESVSVRTRAGTEGERRVDGVLDEADDRGIVIGGRRIAYDEIERARTRFDWGAAPKPGHKKPGHKNRAAS